MFGVIHRAFGAAENAQRIARSASN